MLGKIIGFLIAPLVVPVVFIVGKLFAENTYEMSDLIGIFINNGIYAYIFTLVLGIPALLILMRINKTQLVHFVIAGLILSAAPCIFFYILLGIVKASFFFQCVLSTLLATIIFWFIAFKLIVSN